MYSEQVTPKSYPVNLIDKDWSKRKLAFNKRAKDAVHDMEVLEDDVWIVTYPKCGTTWMQELCWLLLNDCNFEAALSKDLELRSPYLEFSWLIEKNDTLVLKSIKETSSPRLIKSHLPLPLLPAELWKKKPKVIYVFRNPKDAWVSAYYHGVTLGLHCGKSLHEVFDNTLKKRHEEDPIIHATEFYELRNEPWVFYTSFNRMKQNLRGVIEDLCKFLNKSVTEQQMERLLKHLSFDEMKKNPTTNHLWELRTLKGENAAKNIHNFLRKGKVDGYKEELSPELIEKADRYLAQRLEENKVTLEELLLLDK